MKKKITLFLCGILTLSAASAAVVVQNTTTTTTETQPDEIAIGTYEISESPMSSGEAAWAISRASAVVAMDIDSTTTVSEQAFALSSLLFKTDKSEALNILKEVFYNASTTEARVYALMGIYSLGDNSEFNELLNSINNEDTLVAVVSGKSYTVSIAKFFETFKKNPQMFLPTTFPPKNLSFEKAVSSANNSTTSTTTKTTTTTVAFTTFPAMWYSDIVFWNPFFRPIVVFSHHKRPHHFNPRPLPHRPTPAPMPRFKNDHPKVYYKPAPAGKPKFGSAAKGVKNRTPQGGTLTNVNFNKAPSSKTAPNAATPKSGNPAPKVQPPKTSKPESSSKAKGGGSIKFTGQPSAKAKPSSPKAIHEQRQKK